MTRYLIVVALLYPVAAFPFQSIPLPDCPNQGDANAAACKIEYAMADAYNDRQGDIPAALSECAGVLDEFFEHRIATGLKHDGRVAMCTQAAMHLGVLQSIY